MRDDLKLPLVIFLSSCSTLAYEVLLTRIFSVSLWYHFAFMIISIAMLGFAASGVLLALNPRLKELSLVPAFALSLAVSIDLSYLLANLIPFDPARLSWEGTQILNLGCYYLVLAVPFFWAGLIVAAAFSSASQKAGLLYGADLVGAGCGSLGVLLLLGFTAPERAVFLLAAATALAPLAFGRTGLRAFSFLLIAANMVLFFQQPRFTALRVSPYKGLPAALLHPGAQPLNTRFSAFAVIDTFKSPGLRFAPGLSLRYQEPLPEQIGLAVDKGEINAVTSAADPGGLAFLDYLPSALPYKLRKPGRVLVLDPKGGLQVLVARRNGAATIDRVETNPALVEVIRNDYRAFSGDLYGDRTWTALGRSWLVKRKDRFDLIDLSLLGTEPGGAFGIAEDYRFTVEGFKEYLGHLEDDGLLSLNLYIIPPPRTELRLLATAAAALEELGVKDAARHVAALRSWGSVCILVKRTPLTGGEIEAVRRFARDRWFDLVHLPGMSAQESNVHIRMSGNDYFAAFRDVLDRRERDGFTASYIFDIRPVRDDAPFFHYYLRLGKTGETYQAMGRKWTFFLEQGYLLPAVFLQALATSLVLLLLPALARKSRKSLREKGAARLFPYFALLGVGYMFVEIPLVQGAILPLENPSHAVAAILASILVSSGIGSLLSYRLAPLRKPGVCAAISLLIAIYSFALPFVAAAVAPYPLPLKMALLILLFFPLGALMGIPFPTGLQLLGEASPALIPWAWVINGSFSVLAPLLAVMAAMEIGFSRVLLLGALAYLLAFVNLKTLKGQG